MLSVSARKIGLRLASDWFAIDIRSLAAMRMLLACAVLARLSDVMPHYIAFFSDDGILPRRLLFAHTYPSATSLYFLNGSPAFALALLWANVLAAIALLSGYRTRLATVLCWVLNVSLAMRNPYITTGGDALTSLLLFWSMFLPLGATISVDSAMAGKAPSSPSHLSIATVGLLLQALYVYFFGALLKTGPEWVTNGSAVYAALNLETTATHAAHWLRQHPIITYWLTLTVYWLELLSPLLLFSPVRTAFVRTVILPAYVLMHIGFRIFLSISNFWTASIASLSAFTPSRLWDWLDRTYWRPEQKRIVIHYDGDCDFCRKTALLLREFCLPHQVQVGPAEGEMRALLAREQSWVVTDWAGREHLHWSALVFVFNQSLALRPVAWLLSTYGKLGLGKRSYDFIGRNRKRLGFLTSDLNERPAIRLSPAWQAMLVAVIAFCLAWNVRNSFGSPSVPPWAQAPVDLALSIGLLQHWGMFAPMPQLSYVVPVVEARLRSGAVIDAINERAGPPSYDWPRYPIDAIRSAPWRKYFDAIGVHSTEVAPLYFQHYATFICNSWNRRHSGPARMAQLKLTLLVGRTLSGGVTDRSARRVYAYRCAIPR